MQGKDGVDWRIVVVGQRPTKVDKHKYASKEMYTIRYQLSKVMVTIRTNYLTLELISLLMIEKNLLLITILIVELDTLFSHKLI